jgi:hypothetical protein
MSSYELKDILNNDETFEKACREMFDKIDTNKNGTIEKSEIRDHINDIRKSLGKGDVNEEALEKQFNSHDLDGDGTIDFDEFKPIYKEMAARMIKIADKLNKNIIIKDKKENNNLENILNKLNEQNKKVETEINEIKEYLEDNSKKPKTINVSQYNKRILDLRLKFLPKYNQTITEAINIIKDVKNIDVEQTKGQVDALMQCHVLNEDPRGYLTLIIDNLNLLRSYANP